MIQVPELLTPVDVEAPEPSPSNISPLAAAAGDFARRQGKDFVHSMETVATINPDSYAKATAVSRFSGVPAKVLHDHNDRMQQLLRGNEYAGIYDRYRKTANALRDGNLAAISQDDLDQLTRIEGAASDSRFNERGLGEKLWGAVRQQWIAQRQATDIADVSNLVGLADEFDAVDTEVARATEAGAQPFAGLREPVGFAGEYLRATPEQREVMRSNLQAQQAEQLGSAAADERTLADMPVDPGARRAAQLEAAGQGGLAATAEALVENPGYALRTTVGAAATSAPMLLAGAAGGPLAGASVGFSTEYNAKVLDVLREAGVNPDDPKAVIRALQDEGLMADAERRAGLKAAGTTAVDLVSMGLASKLLAPARIAGRQLSASQRELANLAIQFPVQGITEGGGEAAGQFLAEGKVDAGEVLLETVAGAGMSSADVLAFSNRRFVEALGDGLRRSRETRVGAEVLGEMVDATTSGKTRGRDRETFRAIALQQLQDSPMESVWLPAEALQRLNQSAQINLPELLQEVPGLAEQFADAAARGGSVSMKTADYLAVFADYHDLLGTSVRIDVDGMSPADVEAWNAEQESQLDALAEQLRTPPDAADELSRQMVGELVASGYRRADAEQYAATHLSVMQNLAGRTGVALEQLRERFQLDIGAKAPEQLRAVTVNDARLAIQRLRTGDIPQPADMFGQSLREYLVAGGGLADTGGELAALDADVGRVGRNRLARQGGKSLDQAAMDAWERGYFPGVPREEVGPQLIVDAIQRDLAGEPTYSAEQENAMLRDQVETLRQLQEFVDRLGVDISDMSDDEVLALLRGQGEPVEGQRLEQFAGPTAWTADVPALEDAQQRLAAGEDAEQVRQVTGWFQGVDGRWRFEIDDSAAKFQPVDTWLENAEAEGGVTLGEALEHPRLFAAYPELAQVRLIVEPERTAGGYFGVAPGRGLTGSLIVIGDPSNYDLETAPAIDVLMHEIQHAIQMREGFAPGGSPDVLRAEKDQALADRDYWSAVATLRQDAESLGGDYDQARQNYIDVFERDVSDQQLLEAEQAESLEQLRQRVADAEQVMRDIANPSATYQRLAGEIEARNVEARRDLTAEQRRDIAPEDTADIPADRAVVRWNGTEMVSEQVNAQAGGEVRLNQAAAGGELQRALAMTEDEYIAAINPTGKTSEEGDVVLVHVGDLERPRGSRKVASFSDNTGAAVNVFVDNIGTLYAEQDGEIVGQIESRDGETLNIVAQEVQGRGIGTGLAAEMIRREPFAQAGSFSPAGEATRRAAFRKLKAEQQRLNQAGQLQAIGSTPFQEGVSQARERFVNFGPYAWDGSSLQRDGEALGTLKLRVDGNRLVIDDIQITRRGQGAGTEAIRAIASTAQENGLFVALTTDAMRGKDAQKRLRAYYERIGFVANKKQNKLKGLDEEYYLPSARLEQGGEDDTARGFITFQPRQRAGEQRRFQITLGEKRDLTTLLHELGHFYLEVMDDIAAGENAPEQIARDVAKIREWVGAEGGAPFTVEQHEQFARGFERYLAEGKAPNPELAGAFARFKRWIIGFYKDLTRLNVELTDEVRAVFDRLVATDEQITAAEQVSNAIPLFADAQAAGMSDSAFAAYQDSLAVAHAEAQESVEREVQREEELRRSKFWREESARVRQEVTEEIDTLPVYAAMTALRTGVLPDGGTIQFKLNSAELAERYGQQATRKLAFMHTRNGQPLDLAASVLSFESGDAMVKEMLGAVPRGQMIKQETEQRMLERHGPKSTGEAAERALDAVHNERRADVLTRELQVLGKQGNRRNITSQQILKEAARRVMAERKVRDIQPAEYQRAEAKAGREAFDALTRGNLDAAYEAKQRQLLNFYMYREARKARENVDAIVARMARFNKRSKREQLGKAGHDYLDQIDAVMEQYEFRTVSLRDLDRRVSFGEWYAKQVAAGLDPYVPEFVLRQAGRINYKELSLTQLQELDEFAANVNHLAKTKNKLLKQQRIRDVKEGREFLAASAFANVDKLPRRKLVEGARSLPEVMQDWLARGNSSLLKMEQVIEWLDGGDANGAWSTLIFQPLADAQHQADDLNRQYTQKVVALHEQWIKARGNNIGQIFQVRTINESMTTSGMLAVALNRGNPSNLKKLLAGQGWQMQTVDEILGHMTEADWRYVEGLWSTVESLWPMIEALEKRVNGVAPPKIEGLTVETQFGDIQGGYWPLVYDPLSTKYADVLSQLGGLSPLGENGTVRATPARGHTGARVDSFAAPILLDASVIANHLNQVILDLTHREALYDVRRLYTNEAREAVTQTLGPDMAAQIVNQIDGIATGQSSGNMKAISTFAKTMNLLRVNQSLAWMGFSVTTVLNQLAGYPQALDYFAQKGARKYLYRAFLKFWADPIGNLAMIRDVSGEMRNRAVNLDASIREAQGQILRMKDGRFVQDTFKGMLNGRDVMVKYAFVPMQAMQSVVDGVVWTAGYEQAGGVNNHDEAVQAGDRAVRLTQTAGGAKDLATIQQNTLAKLFMPVYGYASLLWNRNVDIARSARAGFKEGNPREILVAFERFVYLNIIPALITGLIRGGLPDDDDDDETWANWLAISSLSSVTQGLPIIGPAVAGAFSDFGYSGASPIGQGLDALIRAFSAERNEAITTASLAAFGAFTGFPASQVNRAVRTAFMVDKGEMDDSALAIMRGVLIGPPKE